MNLFFLNDDNYVLINRSYYTIVMNLYSTFMMLTPLTSNQSQAKNFFSSLYPRF